MDEKIKLHFVIILSFVLWILLFFIAISYTGFNRRFIGTFSITSGFSGLILLILIWFFPEKIIDVDNFNKKIFLIIHGSGLVSLSIWFYRSFRLKFGSVYFLPPITSIAVCIGVFAMFFLMFNKETVSNLFGNNECARKNILRLLGVIFTSFILMMTLLWGLSGELHDNVLYVQSYLLVGLFFYFVGSFYCILADL